MFAPRQQLATAAKAIKHWQQTKPHRNCAVPAPIKEQVLALFDHFAVFELKQKLDLSDSLLHRWSKEAVEGMEASVAPATRPREFIALPKSEPEPEPENPVSNNLSLELSVGEQCHIRLTGDISVQQLDVFTRNIFMYQAGVKK